MATIDIVKEVLADNLDINPDDVVADATFEGLGIDSLDMVELVCEIEDRCDIEFGDGEGIQTIGQLIEHIDSK